MAREVINVGAAPNDGQGDPIRTAYIKTNNNFAELYSAIQLAPPLTLYGSVGNKAGMIAYSSTAFYYCFQDYDGVNIIWGELPIEQHKKIELGYSLFFITHKMPRVWIHRALASDILVEVPIANNAYNFATQILNLDSSPFIEEWDYGVYNEKKSFDVGQSAFLQVSVICDNYVPDEGWAYWNNNSYIHATEEEALSLGINN
jgi:hypothetical protein